MISSVTFRKDAGERARQSYASWAWDLPDIKAMNRNRRVSFQPGLNVLFGRNGSGKTTIVKTVALTLAAVASGRSVQTETWLRQTVDSGIASRPRGVASSRIAADVAHDGRPVVYGAAGVIPGMAGGGAGFSEDFFEQGVSGMFASRGRSAGQMTLLACSDALSVLRGDAPFPKEIQRRMRKESVNDLWQDLIAFADENFLKGSEPEGQPTVLLDEPDAHWSFVAQSNLWRTLGDPGVAERFQVIVATHSPFALSIPHANVIAMSPEAVEETRLAMAGLARGAAAAALPDVRPPSSAAEGRKASPRGKRKP